MEIILATNNEHKLKEIQAILLPYNIYIKSLKDLNYNQEIIENGDTFFLNAYIKAKTIMHYTNQIVMADDSGICVEALKNRPGVYSARYSKTGKDDDNNQLLLNELVNKKNRKAYYHCSIVVCFPKGKYRHYQGRCHGVIAKNLSGNNGFGYDPLFIPKGYNDTFGVISEDIKNQISHRSRALKKLVKDLKKYTKYFQEEKTIIIR